jgi:hypothetical protein
MIMIMIVIMPTTASTRPLQFFPFLLGLTAVFTVLVLSVFKASFRFVNSLLALVIPVASLDHACTRQQERSGQQ